ncbi:MAG: GDSL-type esterase/lipase family protein [Vicinamibacterales bacterium]
MRSVRLLVISAAIAAASIGAAAGQTAVVSPQTGPAGAAAAQSPAAPGRGQGGRGATPVVIGPSAPVPAEVTMLRPSADELGQINQALKKFVDNDKSSAKPVLKKYESLVMMQPPRLNTAATYTQTTQRQGPRHLGFVETAKAGNIDLLLDGDSITDFWVQNDEQKQVFDKYFGKIRTANFAISGDTTQGVLWGLHNGEGQGFQPKAIMLMIGTNNGTHTAPEVAEGVGAVVLEMRRDFPDAKILLLAIFPRSVPGDPVRDKIAEVNRLISKLDDKRHIFYMDIGSKFLDSSGVFLPGTFRPDNLHPLAPGYEIWGQAVQSKLADLMK